MRTGNIHIGALKVSGNTKIGDKTIFFIRVETGGLDGIFSFLAQGTDTL
jgi:hypothetical protein